jgi:predicted PurR-regulated permease PerM
LRFRRSRQARDETGSSGEQGLAEGSDVLRLDEGQLVELSAVFAAPRWLRDLGFASWLTVGTLLVLLGLIWLLGATATITEPVIGGFVIACVTSPVVRLLARHHIGRAAGAAIVLLLILAIGVLVVVLVIGGITSQSDEVSSAASDAGDRISSWLEDVGVDSSSAASVTDSAQKDATATLSTLVHGIATGISGLASLVLGLSFALLSIFFLLKDGPSMRAWVTRHMGVPPPVGRTITGDVIVALQRYFGGVTIVAAYNALVVGIGALVLGVPLVGTIAIVTFICAYIPYIGAFVAGALAVVVALGSEGTGTALIMLVIVILANGALQQIVQPLAYGAALNLNPLVVLIVTVGAGALFGMLGLVLAAPLTSAAVHITADLARARAPTPEANEEPPLAGDEPAPSLEG